jgi:glycine oxidase
LSPALSTYFELTAAWHFERTSNFELRASNFTRITPVKVIVIGAGVIGCAVAGELAARGAQVEVVDPRPIAAGATHASAGMLAPYSEGHHDGLLALGLASLSRYDAFVDRLRRETRLAFEYERAGTLQIANGASESEQLRAVAAEYQAKGVVCEWLDAPSLRDAAPSLTEQATGAVLLRAQGYVDATGMTRALAAAAQQRGVRFTAERVLNIADGAAAVTVTTAEGAIEGDALVLAAGSWSSAIAGVTAWPPPVKPIRGQLLHLRAASRIASRILWSTQCYIVPWHNGTTLVGATVEDVGFDERPTAEGVHRLLSAAQALVPLIGQAAFENVRVGLRPKTPDELPIIGPSSTMRHVFHATGHYRNGILLTPLTAELIADLVLDEREHPELALTSPARFGL